MLVSYNWLKDYLGEGAPTAQEVADLLGAHAFEIEDIEERDGDTVIDIDVLPNRSSDCLSHRGIAREVATLTGKPLEYDPFAETPSLPETNQVSISIENTEACPHFTATLFTGIEVKESPQWLQKRLAVLGQRSINNIVDATNYVMLALGQPMHVYDADLFPQVDGQWKLGARTAQVGETVSLLPEGAGNEPRVIELQGTETLVIDEGTNTPIGLAGVKGGTFAEVHAGSKNIIVEAATWHPTITRQTARRLGIVIDASKRYENNLSPEMPLYAQAEIVKLIADIAGGTFAGAVDVYPEKWEETTVQVNPANVNALLGIELSSEEMVTLLRQAGIVVDSNGTILSCTGPWERTDLSIEADFIEEIGRIYGYDHVASVVPGAMEVPELNVRHFYSEQVRDVLTELGYSEVITSSFRKKDAIKLRNALASDKGCLRSSLHKNIAEVLDKNVGFVDLLGAQDTRVFEVGTVFEKKEGGGVAEHVSLAFGVRTKQSGYNPKDDVVVTETVAALEEKLGTTLSVSVDKAVAEINFTGLFESLPVPTEYEPVEIAEEIVYKPFSTFQHMTRDIAFWVSEGTSVAAAQEVIAQNASELCVRITHVDEFTKDGRTSLAFRLVFQATDRTLTDEEVNTEMEQVYTAAQEQGWETR